MKQVFEFLKNNRCPNQYVTKRVFSSFARPVTVELQWLEHGWLVYRGDCELVLDSPEKIT